MADRDPRRRKRRKDPQKRDDVRSDETLFMSSSKSEVRDSDQEVEEEYEVHHHSEPGVFSQVVFVILFSGLVISMGVIFISLRSVDKGSADLFDHGEHVEELHLDQLNDAVYVDQGDHLDDDHNTEDVLDDDHNTEDVLDDDHGHAEDEVSLGDLFESGISTLSSFFSTRDEEVETATEPMQEVEEPPESETLSEQDIVEAADEDMVEEYNEKPIEQSASEVVIEETAFTEAYTTPVSSYQDDFSYSEPEEFSTTPAQSEDTDPPVESYVPDNEEFEVPTTENTNMFESEDDLSFYERADITSQGDYDIRDELDDVERSLEKSPEKVLTKCGELLQKNPLSPRAHYLKAQALDRLAELHRSNKQLEEAIAAYQKVMSLSDVPDKLYLLAGRRAAERLRFRGFTGKSVKLLSEMAVKFPLDTDLKNEVAVGYLLIGQNVMSKNVLLDVLKHDPDSGFAKVHLGFILKTADSNYEESIKYLQEGIASREPGVIDGRFYFHLGDALHRTGKKEEALKVYEEAVKEGLFLSVYQRSLYNVNGLTGKPWWDPNSTRYAPDFKILEKNWKMIRDEALSLIDDKSSGFMPETEGLQETGDWKQLELFARGRKIEKNCLRAPKTCAVISQIPDAASCKRGQVKFSIMHPKTHVWAHTGPTNCRLRSHLGLVVPEGAVIRVADEIRKWEEGKVILFDDSFEHEVWHNGSNYRLVLIVDFWHPELTAYQKRSLTPI